MIPTKKPIFVDENKCPYEFPFEFNINSNGDKREYCLKNEKCINKNIDCSNRVNWIHKNILERTEIDNQLIEANDVCGLFKDDDIVNDDRCINKLWDNTNCIGKIISTNENKPRIDFKTNILYVPKKQAYLKKKKLIEL